MAKGGFRSFFKDPIVPTSSGASDLEFEGSAKLLDGDIEIGGQKCVILVGDGKLDEVLSDFER